jgi:hypothetical protein
MDRVEQVVGEVYKESLEDYVGLWTVLWHLRETFGVGDEQVLRNESLKVIECLLKLPDIGVGQFRDQEAVFDFWNLPPLEALTKIDMEWNALRHEPGPGDIAWFTSKD